MKVLVTGAKGFIGKNLCEALKNIRDGKDRRPQYDSLKPLTIYEYDKDSTLDELKDYCRDADFVFNLAGINRPSDDEEFMQGNAVFTDELLTQLEEADNSCPVMLASSVQASLQGRFAESKYGQSKLEGERILRNYSKRTGAPILIYRFPNVYGKWCRPNYNSAIATFCNNIANDLPIQVNDPSTELEVLYIDDLIKSLLDALVKQYQPYQGCDDFAQIGPTDRVTLGEIVSLLNSYKTSRQSLDIPNLEPGSFSKKLYSTYQSYLNPEKLSYDLKLNEDSRGSFIEVLKTQDRGQVAINVTLPGQIKGNHWHSSKWEKFLVISGNGLIQQRRIGLDDNNQPYPTIDYYVSDSNPVVVETPPGFTHNIINTSDTENLVTLIWCNEIFDPEYPDTYYEEV